MGDTVMPGVVGDDSDTVGAIYGSLAGAFYGLNGIPSEWVHQLSFSGLVQVTIGLGCTNSAFAVACRGR